MHAHFFVYIDLQLCQTCPRAIGRQQHTPIHCMPLV